MDCKREIGVWIRKELSFTVLHVQVTQVGPDYSIVIRGGERPHIGCAVLAVPRPSLTGDGSMSSTSSVINMTGHKEEMICRKIAEAVASRRNAAVVCTGGIHVDYITTEQIREVEGAVEEIASEIGDVLSDRSLFM